MGLQRIALMLAGSLAAATAGAQQALVCPPAPAGRPCEAFHFHAAMYRPDSKQFVEIFAGSPYATQAACERAREQYVAANTRVVEYLRSIKQNHEADRVGPCHCDMTDDKTATVYLSDAQRVAQLRTAEEIKLRVRERLLDHKLTSDSEIVKGLWADAPVTPLLATPKLAPLPQTAPAPILTATEDLKPTKTIDSVKPQIAAMNLPLAEIGAPAPPPPAPATDPSAAPAPPVETTAPAPAPAAEPTVEEVVVPEPAPVAEAPPAAEAEPELPSAEETAESFISYETQRIQNVLRAAAAIDDESIKSKIFEASMQRIQLLSNLRLLIEGAGVRSRLAAAARDAQNEPARLAFITRLFSDEIAPHWAPKDAADVVFDIEAEIVAAPERVLRDTTGTVTSEQKKRALYLVLAQTQPAEDQRLWLTSIIEGFLR
jgi:hypothetical protein